MSDMKKLTTRELKRKIACALDAFERGESSELLRNGKAVGNLTHTAPPPERKPAWIAHLDWMKGEPKGRGKNLLMEFEADRRRLRTREKTVESPPRDLRLTPAFWSVSTTKICASVRWVASLAVAE